VLLLLVGCRNAPKQAAPSASAAASAAAAAAVPSAAPAPWFEGAWHGSYKAELHRIELAVGGVKAWKDDDGKQASGEGKLDLQVTADGSVTGSASGALGEQRVSGRVEDERVSLSLLPLAPEGFHGVILAAQAPAGIEGTLSASTGDSLAVRKASVTLAKAGK
jgi:hypothetical protein